MQKSKIEWTDYVSNPIKGICPGGCWYCYARRIYQRFKLDPEPWLDIAELNEIAETRRTGKRVFMCSTFELFHPVVDKLMGRCGGLKGRRFLPARDMIFNAIERRPDLTFIILTKMPERIDRPMPDNVWLGTTVTGWDNFDNISQLLKHDARIRFISMEPLLEVTALPGKGIDWLILGRLTGYGKKYYPSKLGLMETVSMARGLGIKIFLKNNLKEIWGEPLIQELPSLKLSEED